MANIILTKRVTGVPLSVIETPYVKSVGTEAGACASFLLQNPRSEKSLANLQESERSQNTLGMQLCLNWRKGLTSQFVNAQLYSKLSASAGALHFYFEQPLFGRYSSFPLVIEWEGTSSGACWFLRTGNPHQAQGPARTMVVSTFGLRVSSRHLSAGALQQPPARTSPLPRRRVKVRLPAANPHGLKGSHRDCHIAVPSPVSMARAHLYPARPGTIGAPRPHWSSIAHPGRESVWLDAAGSYPAQ